jgi:hypothetical protein
MPKMKVIVLPVSGASFPVQLGLFSELLDQGATYDLALASSGGNVSNYCMAAANYNPRNLPEVVSHLKGHLFAEPWSDVFPTSLPGFWNGNIYMKGEGGVRLFEKFFCGNNYITKIESWTGTTNRDLGRTQLWCNKAEGCTIIKQKNFDPKLVNCKPLEFCSGVIPLIAQVSIASASIPMMVPERQIGCYKYADGGIMYSSPLTPFKGVLEDFLPEGLHIDYISSYDVEKEISAEYCNLMENAEVTLKQILQGQNLVDRNNAVDLMGEGVKCRTGLCNRETLRGIENERRKAKSSVLELYTPENIEVDIVYLEPCDIMEAIEKSKRGYRYRLWIRY